MCLTPGHPEMRTPLRMAGPYQRETWPTVCVSLCDYMCMCVLGVLQILAGAAKVKPLPVSL